MKRSVVITGMGAVTPLGVGAETLFREWVGGRCGIQDGLGRCRDFDPGELLTKKEIRRSDRFTQLALAAGGEALKQSGWTDDPHLPAERVGCIVGTGIGGITTIEQEEDILRERGPRAVSALGVPRMMANAGSAALAMRYGLRGPNHGVVSACAAGGHALGSAMRMIQAGDADACLTGGSESALTRMATAGFIAMSATSPTGISRPFDARRDGFVLGEGAGALLLESAEHAERRGAPILGELLGYGASADAFHLTAPEPEGVGAARAITLALADAGLTPGDIDYVNAHGTSTQLNDRAETSALKLALGEDAHRIPISATKSAVGHLLGAGGAIETVATVLSLRERIAPPTLGLEQVEEGLDLNYVPLTAQRLNGGKPEGEPRIALSNSFGFGGHNAVLCIAA